MKFVLTGLLIWIGLIPLHVTAADSTDVPLPPTQTQTETSNLTDVPLPVARPDNLNESDQESSKSIALTNPLSVNSIEGLLRAILQVVQIIAVPIIVFFIMYAGFLYVTARGNPDQIKTAHTALLYALIGGVLILGATVLIEIIEGTVTQFG